MKPHLLAALLLLTVVALCAEVEIELSTGSTFKGTLKQVTPQCIIVQTALGELKLTRAMLSPRCAASLRADATTGAPAKTKPAIGVQVVYRTKKLETDTQHTRYIHQEVTRSVGILDIKFTYVPTTGTVPARIEYEFIGDARGAARGTEIKIDGGVKLVELQNGTLETVQITSRPVTHGEGRMLREVGAEFKGYRVKIYVDGHLLLEESKP